MTDIIKSVPGVIVDVWEDSEEVRINLHLPKGTRSITIPLAAVPEPLRRWAAPVTVTYEMNGPLPALVITARECPPQENAELEALARYFDAPDLWEAAFGPKPHSPTPQGG